MSNINHTYKVIQLTNGVIGAQAIDTFLPLGNITRKINCKDYNSVPFTVLNSGADTITINESGYYKVTYSASLVAAADGVIELSLAVNNNVTYSVSTTATSGSTVNLTLPYEIRVCPNSECNPYNIPANIQIKLNTTAISGGTSNILVEKVY